MNKFKSIFFLLIWGGLSLVLTACSKEPIPEASSENAAPKTSDESVKPVRVLNFYDEVEGMAKGLVDHVKQDCSKETIGGREKCYQAWQKSMRAEWRDAESATARYQSDKAWSHFRFRELNKTTWQACMDKAKASGYTLEVVHCYARMYAFHQTWVNFFENGDYIQTLANDPEHHKFSGEMLKGIKQYDSSQEVGS